ncbi:MAG: cyclase family protein [Chloroflexi bacterium]|nr:cyclase family protein [Chloroflexota bacterium]
MSDYGWIDISVPLHDEMVHWPTDPPVKVERVSDMERGDRLTLSRLSMGSHTGTHIDAPLHFVRQGDGVDLMPVDACVGRARVIQINDAESIRIDELVPQQIHRGERLLFKTRNSSYAWQNNKFVEDFVFMSREAANFLAALKVRMVGIDYLSVGGFKRDGSEVHRALLEAGIWIIEGLDLSQVEPGKFDLICLPIRIAGGDGAPARAIVRPVREG